MTEGTRFSFFPDKEEANLLKSATVKQLSAIFQIQPDMLARFTHELLEIGREEDLKKAFLRISDLPVLALPFIEDLIVSTSVMRSMFGISREDSDKFISDVLRLMNDVSISISFSQEQIVNQIDNLVRLHKARQN